MSVRLSTTDLTRILSDAALFATRDTTLPMINGVRLESSGQDRSIVAVATDRFTLGASMATLYEESDVEEFGVTIKLAQLDVLVRMAKSVRHAFSFVDVTVGRGQVKFDFSGGESITLPEVSSDVPFPDWRRILQERAGADGSVRMVGFNPKYLARFAKVSGGAQMALNLTAANRAALVKVGDQFVGCVMPVRLGDDGAVKWANPGWAVPPKPVEAPKVAAKRPPRKPAAKKAVTKAAAPRKRAARAKAAVA